MLPKWLKVVADIYTFAFLSSILGVFVQTFMFINGRMTFIHSSKQKSTLLLISLVDMSYIFKNGSFLTCLSLKSRLGNCANSLHLGCDCLGAIHYFDGEL